MPHSVILPPVFLFLDTEFTDFALRQPLSVGVIGQDSRRFYVELADADLNACSDFVITQVLTLLGDEPEAYCTFVDASSRLRAWLGAYQGRDVVVVHDYFGDREIFFDLLCGQSGEGRRIVATEQEHVAFRRVGRDLGLRDLLPMDVGSRVNQEAIARYFDINPAARRHHAFDDAQALMAAFLAHPAEAGAAHGGLNGQ